jgi:hypothetical protein
MSDRGGDLLMKCLSFAAAALAISALSACVAPVGPVEVTRFHVPQLTAQGRGAIAVQPAPGQDAQSLEYQSYASAVARQLILQGYIESRPGNTTPQIAIVRIERRSFRPGRAGSPVSVGIGGQTGSYGSGVGLGVGVDLSGPPPEQVETRLSVTIRERASGRALWEGKASFTVDARSPVAQTPLGAAKLAEALFRGFPGTSGETILVK